MVDERKEIHSCLVSFLKLAKSKTELNESIVYLFVIYLFDIIAELVDLIFHLIFDFIFELILPKRLEVYLLETIPSFKNQDIVFIAQYLHVTIAAKDLVHLFIVFPDEYVASLNENLI